MSIEQHSAEKTESQNSEPLKKRNNKRRFFLTLGPILVATVSLYIYWTGGRYVHTDNAYVQADKIAVSPEVSGTVLEVLVKENDFVEKGTPLLKIDPRSYIISLEQRKASLQDTIAEIKKLRAGYQQKISELGLAQSAIDFANKEYKRLSVLDSNHAVAKSQFDNALHNFQVSKYRFEIIRAQREQILAQLEGDPEIEANQLASYRLAQALLEKAALDLEKTTVLAPFSGRVSKIPQVGKHIKPGALVMSLIANTNFWIEANLKETELTHVLPGQKVAIEVDTYPDIEFTGIIQSISPGTGSQFSILPAQNATGNWVKVVQRIPVRVHINDSVGQQILRSGMSTTVSIDTEYHQSLPAWVKKSLNDFGMTTGVSTTSVLSC
jgi:membrane fusion protein (multidrug efflux system)